jgi:hypothetical protein
MLFLEERAPFCCMDMVGYSRDGKASNLHSIDRQYNKHTQAGDGSIISPTKGASAGVYAVMRDDATGKTFNYMHLDPKLGTRKRSI